jgi:hypothetical protein
MDAHFYIHFLPVTVGCITAEVVAPQDKVTHIFILIFSTNYMLYSHAEMIAPHDKRMHIFILIPFQ